MAKPYQAGIAKPYQSGPAPKMRSVSGIHRKSLIWGMKHPRLYCPLMALLSLTITLYNWHILRTENRYYLKAAIICPMGVVLFSAATLFPGLLGAEKAKKMGPIAKNLWVFGALAVGLLNWYEMTH
jgi:hypothetical protein